MAGPATSRCLLPCPPRSRPRRALPTPAWPVWSLRGQARPRPAPDPAAGSATDLPVTNATWAASAASRPPGPSIEPSTARQPDGPLPVLVVRVARPPRPGPQRHRLSMGGDGRVRTDEGRHQTAGHRTDGHRTAGHRTAGQQPSDRRTSGRPPSGDRTPDGWTAGSRTPRPDGWTPPAGHRRPTPWRACWQGRPRRPRPTPSIPAGRSSGQTPSGRATTRTAPQQGRRGHPCRHGRVWPPPRRQLPAVRRRPAGASAHCCPPTITGRE